MAREPTTYWDYIKVEELLGLQGGLGDSDADLANDEVLFITVHQIDELWFKLILRELTSLRDLLATDPVPEQSLAAAARAIRRAVLLFQNVARHFELMETMTTRDYLAFRDKLTPASGFQSAQMREIEVLLGLQHGDRVPLGHEASYLQALRNADGSESAASRRVERRLQDTPSLKTALGDWLYRTPIQGKPHDDPGAGAAVAAFVDAYCAAFESQAREAQSVAREQALTPEDAKRIEARYQAEIEGTRRFLTAEDVPEDQRERTSRIRAALVFIESYRELPLLAWPREIVDGLVALEQASIVFRQRHARMVERVIGRRTGTGGSAGVDYLDKTALTYRVFHDLWAVRTLLLPRRALPPLEDSAFYDFAGGH